MVLHSYRMEGYQLCNRQLNKINIKKTMNTIKKIFLAFTCFCSCTIISCAQEIIYDGENNGVLMLSVSEFNIKKNDAVDQAIKDAYFQILFRGIPGSTKYNSALLGTDETIMDKNQNYYNSMINQGRLYTFVNYSALSYFKKKVAVVKLTINVQAIIADLETNNLYKRFGFF